MAGMAALAGILLSLVLLLLPLPMLFGGDFAGSEASLRPALLMLLPWLRPQKLRRPPVRLRRKPS